jgi:hypothetical protein
MTMKEELLVLWVCAAVIVAAVVTHIADFVAFALQNFFA